VLQLYNGSAAPRLVRRDLQRIVQADGSILYTNVPFRRLAAR